MPASLLKGGVRVPALYEPRGGRSHVSLQDADHSLVVPIVGQLPITALGLGYVSADVSATLMGRCGEFILAMHPQRAIHFLRLRSVERELIQHLDAIADPHLGTAPDLSQPLPQLAMQQSQARDCDLAIL